jgi:hypothetical protein
VKCFVQKQVHGGDGRVESIWEGWNKKTRILVDLGQLQYICGNEKTENKLKISL